MGRRSSRECYYCGAPATSVEHVPPKCLFPEQKDIAGDQFRRNLITVPSCDAHNLGKSQDDEFLMASMSSVVGNNGLGFMHTHTKVRRAIYRTSGRLLDAVMHDPRDVALHVRGGAMFPVLLGRADMPRLCRALEHVARGMYFHVFRERFIGKCMIMPDFVTFGGSADLEVLKKVARLLVSPPRRLRRQPQKRDEAMWEPEHSYHTAASVRACAAPGVVDH
ncbi:MAG: hypothetical protein AB7V19_05300 [Candidatus Bipolaricaulia bacterium]